MDGTRRGSVSVWSVQWSTVGAAMSGGVGETRAGPLEHGAEEAPAGPSGLVLLLSNRSLVRDSLRPVAQHAVDYLIPLIPGLQDTGEPADVAQCDLGRGIQTVRRVRRLPLALTALARRRQALATALVALVDVCEEERDTAVAVCRWLRAQRPALPLLALLCCRRPTEAATLRALTATGVTSVVDWHVSATALAAAIGSVAGGVPVVRVQGARLDGSQGAVPTECLPGLDGPTEVYRVGGSTLPRRPASTEPRLRALPADDQRVLELVAQGWTDAEIGERLAMGQRSISRRVERLCAAVGARNRAHLTAWAVGAGVAHFAPTEPDAPGVAVVGDGVDGHTLASA